MDDTRQRLDVWQLRREPQDGVLGGVCTAVADQLGVDVLLVRVATILLALGAGLGLVAYGWAWLVLPQKGSDAPMLARWVPETAHWGHQAQALAGGAVALAAMLVLGLVVPWSMGPATIVVALVLLGRRAPRHLRRGTRRLQWTSAPALAGGATVAPRTVRRAARADRRRARVARRRARDPRGSRAHAWFMGLLALVVAWGAGVATVSSGRSNVMACGVTVGVLVGALFVAALAGRRRPRLVLPVVLALAAWMACSPWAPGSVNARHDQQPLLASAQAPQRINGSNMTYDLTGTSLEHDTTVTLQPTASKVTVEVPAGVPLVVSYTLSGAALDVEDADDPLHVAGAARDTWRSPTTRTSGPTLTLVITARASAVLVQHA